VSSFLEELHELDQVVVRGPALGDAPARRVPERAHPLLDPVVVEHPLHLAAQLLLGHDAVRAGRHRQAGPPHVADVARSGTGP